MRIAVAGAAVEIAVGEEQLRDVQPVLRKHLRVEMHQLRLPDRRAGLPGWRILRPLLQPERAQARRDRAAGDDQALVPRRDLPGHFPREPANCRASRVLPLGLARMPEPNLKTMRTGGVGLGDLVIDRESQRISKVCARNGQGGMCEPRPPKSALSGLRLPRRFRITRDAAQSPNP